MKMSSCLAIIGLIVAPATQAQRRSDPERASAARRDGVLPPRAVEARVLPMMRDYQYLGFDLDFGAAVYTLKFLRDGTVVWVEVDGRSGQVLRRTGG